MCRSLQFPKQFLVFSCPGSWGTSWGFEGEGLRSSIGSTATFDESSDDMKGTTGDLKDSMVSRGIFGGSRGSRAALRFQ